MTESSFGSLKSSSPSNARCLQILTKSNFEILPDRESPLMIRLRWREKQQPKSASNPQPPGLRPQLVGAEFAPPRPCAKFQARDQAGAASRQLAASRLEPHRSQPDCRLPTQLATERDRAPLPSRVSPTQPLHRVSLAGAAHHCREGQQCLVGIVARFLQH